MRLLFLTGLLSLTFQQVHAGKSINSYDFQTKNIYDFGIQGTGKVVLTFDDGPNANTSRLLNLLRKYNLKATFFVLGQAAAAHPEIMQVMKDDGHIIANHSKNHADLGKSRYQNDPGRLVEQIEDTHNITKSYFQNSQRWYFRAPYGAWKSANAGILNALPELKKYIGPIFWDIGGAIQKNSAGELTAAADWDCWYREYSVEKCLRGYKNETLSRNGGVVLAHDVHSKTVTMMESYIPWLVENGYQVVTMDELRSLDKYEAK